MPEPIWADIPSSVPGIAWPAIPNTANATYFAVAAQLTHTERLPETVVRARQLGQLDALLRHAMETVPYYRERLRPQFKRRKCLDWDFWQRLPRLQRTDIQAQFESLKSGAVPENHGAISDARTSGSTGTPITVLGTSLTQTYYRAAHLRKYRWHATRFEGRACAMRVLHDKWKTDWGEGQAVSWCYGIRTGVGHVLDVRAPLDYQADWLTRCRPDHLLTLPSNLAALADFVQGNRLDCGFLRQLHTYGEILDERQRERAEDVFGLPVIDMYSTNELGVLAIQAPDRTEHRVMAETHLVEVLSDDGTPCVPGETGRVVVTPLHNFAMPLIRYELGD